jgi:transposase InsO family protein
LRTKYSIRELCDALQCSRSGYYDWIALGRPEYKHFDWDVAERVKAVYEEDTTQGLERLQMNTKNAEDKPLNLSLKRVYRIMKILDIRSITARRPKKYPRTDHHTIPNHLRRDFTTTGPNQKWSIDVTYIHTVEGIEYLCAIKDLHDKSIIAYAQSRFNDNPLVLQALNQAVERVPQYQREDLILHSDQGSQFTSRGYIAFLKEHRIIHSVSAQGSCADNVPIESWFSLLKCECIYLHRRLTRIRAKELVSTYVDYYNLHRRQKQIDELAPMVFRQLVLQ